MTATMKKEFGVINHSSGMGGFLNPPTHPEHTNSVEIDLDKRKENRGCMSLSAAVECEWLSDTTRAWAKELLDGWKKPNINSPEVKKWIRQVLGYFKNCYKGAGEEPECWHAGKLDIVPEDSLQLHPIDEHAGVHFIRQYYPEYVPTEQEFKEAKWGD